MSAPCSIEVTNETLAVLQPAVNAAIAYAKMTNQTRKIELTGELGELLACHCLGLRLVVDSRSEGFDALDVSQSSPQTVQIKSRRSERDELPKDSGRLGTFSNHPFNYALMVILDARYALAEIWKAPASSLNPIIEKHKRRNPTLREFKKVGQKVFSQ